MNRPSGTNGLVILLLASALIVTSCDDIKQSPQVITADGATYVACKGLVWVSSEGGGLLGGGGTFKVSYTDARGLEHVLRGIRKLSVEQLPKMEPVPIPYPLPDVTAGRDKDGNSYREGVTYTWPDGSQAVIRGGQWQVVMRPNTACQPQ